MSDSNNWLEECYQSYRKFCIDNEVFRKAAWTKADGDHTHCLFDAQKISNYDIDDNDKQGYCGDKGTWFCASCFEELIKRHNVKVEKNTILSIENALRRYSNVIISLNNEQYFLKNKDEKMLLAEVLDKIENTNNRNKIEHTDFLDLAQNELVQKFLNKQKVENYIKYGGVKKAH